MAAPRVASADRVGFPLIGADAPPPAVGGKPKKNNFYCSY